MPVKQHTIPISVFIVLSSLILSYPAFSQDTPARFTLQLLHAADLEGGVEALDNAPRFSAVLNALKAEEENTVIIGAGDTYIPGAFSPRATTRVSAMCWGERDPDARTS